MKCLSAKGNAVIDPLRDAEVRASEDFHFVYSEESQPYVRWDADHVPRTPDGR